jgi:hypothetical protein
MTQLELAQRIVKLAEENRILRETNQALEDEIQKHRRNNMSSLEEAKLYASAHVNLMKKENITSRPLNMAPYREEKDAVMKWLQEQGYICYPSPEFGIWLEVKVQK